MTGQQNANFDRLVVIQNGTLQRFMANYRNKRLAHHQLRHKFSMSSKEMLDLQTIRKAWSLLDRREQRNAWIVFIIIIFAALSSALMVGSVIPFLTVLGDPNQIEDIPFLSWAYEAGGFQSDYRFVIALGLASLSVIVASTGLQLLRVWVVANYTHMRASSLSCKLLTHYLSQPYEFFLKQHSAEQNSKILTETSQIVRYVYQPAFEVISSLLTAVAIIFLLVLVDPMIALVAFSTIGGTYGTLYAINRRALSNLGLVRAKANTARFLLANEALGGTKEIKLAGIEHSYLDLFSAASNRFARTVAQANVIGSVPSFAIQAVGFGGIILITILFFDESSLSSGEALGDLLPMLGALAFAGQRLLPELQKVYMGLTDLQYGGAAVEQVYIDLSSPVQKQLDPQLAVALPVNHCIELENVNYYYPLSQEAGLQSISLKIETGNKIGIVGGTGAGKSTLIDVILGLLSPTEGSLVVDGVVISQSNIRAWQRTFGYVPQDIFLSDGTIAQNIALGVPKSEIDYSRISQVARAAHIDSFIINKLPEAYESRVGERGIRLSGGQRQRIGIARALYHNAQVIVFDEATSALDNLTELEVMKAIDSLPGDKTVFMVAHRLSTVRACDRILVMQDGKVVGDGSWDHLITTNAIFQKLAKAG